VALTVVRDVVLIPGTGLAASAAVFLVIRLDLRRRRRRATKPRREGRPR
jgi:hypothetical protein